MPRLLDADHSQILLLPTDISQWVPPDHPARFIWDLVDLLDLGELGIFVDEGELGRPRYAPKLLLRRWLYGWMDRVRSSRGLEKRCMTDLAYIWLTGNLRPDHNTIWRFFRCNKRALPKLFKRVVRLAVDADLVGFALHAVDGTKIQAVSSTESALHRSVLQDKLRQIDELIEQSVKEMEKAQQEGGESFRLPQGLTDARARRAVLEQGLARLDAEQTEHLSLGEPDARVMKSRQGKRLSYNAQAAVDHDSDLIVAADVTNEEDDHRLLVPMIDQVLENTGETAETTSADAGYFSGEQK